jgi:hypothetical protein
MRISLRAALLVLAATAMTPTAAQSREPKPEDALRGTIAAFESYRVVALGDYHGTKDLYDFVFALIRHPAFPAATNDIVVECTSVSIQPLLDRFIAGDDVPIADARRLWRDQTHPPCSVDPLRERLFKLVRRVNQTLEPARRLRVLAGEPPLDWKTLTPERHRDFMEHRETSLASVLSTEVIARGRKALVLYGGGHLNHGVAEMAMGRFEEKHPGVAFVIALYTGASEVGRGCGLPATVNGLSIDAKLRAWPVPSLARTKGTWLADFDRSRFSRPIPKLAPGVDPIDAYLYLGPPDVLLREPPSVYPFLDPGFTTELQRRGTVMIGTFRDPRTEPERVLERELDAFACGG